MTKIKIFTGYWTVLDVKHKPESLFIFGDNDAQFGKRGQAIIRDLPNAIGIPTKKYPANNNGAFYTDSQLQQNKIKITNAINRIIAVSKNYNHIYLPEDGLGTGLAKLQKKAPQTYQFLLESINNLTQII